MLSRSLPADPLVALARAREKLGDRSTLTALRVRRAYDELDAFRDDTDHVPLDDLRPGATRAWMEFYLQLDAEAAFEFVKKERDRLPEKLDLWLMLGETLVATGEPEAAIDHYRLVLEMMPGNADAPIARPAPLALRPGHPGDRGARLRRREDRGTRTRSPDGALPGPGPDQRRRQAAGGGHRPARGAVLPTPADSATSRGPRSARLLGTALVLRGTPKDMQRAEVVLTNSLPSITDPIRRNFAQALLYLASRETQP